MRRLVRSGLAVIALLAAPAFAQPVLDGKAKTDAFIGPFVENYINSASEAASAKSTLRSIMGAMTAKGLNADDQDLLFELASGQAVEVSMGAKTLRVPPLQGEVLAIAKLMSGVPNLNTLWKQPGEPTLVLIELSRWGEKPKERVIGFMANKLYATWPPSTINNSYSPLVQEFAGIYNAISGIADRSVRNEATLLLKAAMEQVLVKCKADGRPPPPYYLYGFAFESVGAPKEPQ